MEYGQKTLYEFFEMVDKPTWQIQLRDIIKSRKMNIWEIDIKDLSKEYMDRIGIEKDLNKSATAMLICSILLKYKSRKLGLKELESYIEEEIEELMMMKN